MVEYKCDVHSSVQTRLAHRAASPAQQYEQYSYRAKKYYQEQQQQQQQRWRRCSFPESLERHGRPSLCIEIEYAEEKSSPVCTSPRRGLSLQR